MESVQQSKHSMCYINYLFSIVILYHSIVVHCMIVIG